MPYRLGNVDIFKDVFSGVGYKLHRKTGSWGQLIVQPGL